MDNQIILTNNDFKKQDIQSVKGGKKKTGKKNRAAKHNAIKKKGIKNKKDGKLSFDEKNFLAILVHHFLKKEGVNKKSVRKMENGKDEKKVKVKKTVKSEIKKGKINRAKDNINLHAEKLMKNREKFSKTKSAKVALEKFIPEKARGKVKKNGINKKISEIKNSKENEFKTELINNKKKGEVSRAKVSKIEEIKISPNTKEIKFENFKPEKPEVNKAEVRKSNLIEEVARIVQNTTPKGSKIFRIHIEPPELGKMYIQLSFSQDKKMDMKIYVQKPEVQHYLNSGIETLKTNIENLGLKFDLPVIQTLSEFNSGEKGNEKGKEGESQKKIKFRLFREGKENSEYYEEYIGVMDYLSGRVDIRA